MVDLATSGSFIRRPKDYFTFPDQRSTWKIIVANLEDKFVLTCSHAVMTSLHIDKSMNIFLFELGWCRNLLGSL